MQSQTTVVLPLPKVPVLEKQRLKEIFVRSRKELRSHFGQEGTAYLIDAIWGAMEVSVDEVYQVLADYRITVKQRTQYGGTK